MAIISSLENFSEQFKGREIVEKPSERLGALKKYFDNGGVISVAKSGKQWPKLIYPHYLKVRSDITEASKLKANLVSKQREWHRTLKEARIYHAKHNVLKLSNPLYWKHISKAIRDPSYKEAAKAVKLPAHLVSDPRWEPMIRTFLNDPEYRQQLTETVKTSIVYGKDRKVAKYADALNKFRSELSEKNIEILNKKIAAIDGRLSTLKEIQKWTRE